MVVVLIKTTRAVDATNRADIRRRSTMNTSSVVDVLNLSGGIMTAVTVEAAVNTTAA